MEASIHRSVTFRAPGTCGELAQGLLDGEPFLVTCPVSRYSWVTVREGPAGLVQGPPRRWKMRRALSLFLERRGCGTGLSVSLTTQIAMGKGMASSTADITAAVMAAAAFTGAEITPDETASIALAVEPSDGVMFPGIVLFDHVAGRRVEHLGEAPGIRILACDLGGAVDTLAFNRRDTRKARLTHRRRLEEALDLIRRGLRDGSPSLIGEGATISARCNQEILAKPELEDLIAVCLDSGGLGVNVAHSGTMAGLLFPSSFSDFGAVRRKVAQALGRRCRSLVLDMVGGGGERVEGFARREPQGDGGRGRYSL
jgi:L-threonine kinase